MGRVHFDETALRAVKPVVWRVAGVQRDIVEIVYGCEEGSSGRPVCTTKMLY